MKLRKRDEIELQVENLAFGGKGIAHLNGLVVFVEGGLPGDRVRARVHRVKKQFAEARVLEVLEASALRTEPPCPYFGTCGGCKWQHLQYEEQLRYKRQHVLESLERLALVTDPHVLPTLPAPQIYGYRNKMEFSFSDNRWLTPAELENPEIKKGFALGFHVPGFFDRVIDIDRCLLQPQPLNEVLQFSRPYFRDSGIPVYHLRKHIGVLRYLVLRYSFAHQQVMVNVVTAAPIVESLKSFAEAVVDRVPQVVSVINNVNPRPAQIAYGEEEYLIKGQATIRENIGDFTFEISANSFFQTNSQQAERLYEIVKDYAAPEGKTVWDLYSGTGTIAIYLSRMARKVLGFELIESAVKDAERNARLNRVENCSFIHCDLRTRLAEMEAVPPPEVIICDPPRDGMHKDVVKKIKELAPERIVYVSCNPATMARDIALLKENYHLEGVQPVDMFPHTPHIESVARLVRK